MKLILLLVTVLSVATTSSALAYTASGTNPRTFVTDGSRTDVAAAIGDSTCVDGSIVTLPAGNFTYSTAITVNKNIWIKGAKDGRYSKVGDPAATIIQGCAAFKFVSKPVDATLQLSHVVLNQPTGCGSTPAIAMGGYAQVSIDPVDGTAHGGFRVHHLKWSGDIGTATTANPSTGGRTMYLTDWVTGVIDHCHMDHNRGGYGGETIIIQHQTNPSGTNVPSAPKYGDASWFLPYNFASSAFDSVYLEDNIFNHQPYVVDCLAGGGRFVARYNTSNGKVGGHGTGETGGRPRGTRAHEAYNNRFYQEEGVDASYGQTNAEGWRAGSGASFNNRFTGWDSQPINAYGYRALQTYETPQGILNHEHGADGTNGWDENWRTDTTTLAGAAVPVKTSYNNDTVADGVDTLSQRGAVYASGTVATGGTGTFTLNGLPSGSGTTDFWRSFVIRDVTPVTRNAETRPKADWYDVNPSAFGYIRASSGSSVSVQAPPKAGTMAMVAGADYEIRRVKTYMDVPGAGKDTIQHTATDPAALPSGSPNPRWTGQVDEGIHQWANLRRQKPINSFGPITGFQASDLYAPICRTRSNSPKPGYPYGPTTADTGKASVNTELRVGADWDTAAITSGPDLPSKAGGSAYPHPLVSGDPVEPPPPPEPSPTPVAPTGLTAAAASSTQINLAWTDNATNEAGYRIERSSDNVNFTQIAQLQNANVTTYQNTGLTAPATFYYRVRAYNNAGNSGYSNVADALISTTTPAAPTNLTATVKGATQIDLAWQAGSTNANTYKIERATGIGGTLTWSEIGTTSVTVTTYQSTGLTATTGYSYRVRAYSTNSGNSAYSNVATGTTQAVTTAPSPPNIIYAGP